MGDDNAREPIHHTCTRDYGNTYGAHLFKYACIALSLTRERSVLKQNSEKLMRIPIFTEGKQGRRSESVIIETGKSGAKDTKKLHKKAIVRQIAT